MGLLQWTLRQQAPLQASAGVAPSASRSSRQPGLTGIARRWYYGQAKAGGEVPRDPTRQVREALVARLQQHKHDVQELSA